MMAHIWSIVLQVGSIVGLIAIPGSIYLFFESHSLGELEAKRDLRIAQSALAEIETDKAKKISELEEVKRSMGRVSNPKINELSWNAADMEQQRIRFHQSPEEGKLRAEIAFNKAIANRGLFWFLKKKNVGAGNLLID